MTTLKSTGLVRHGLLGATIAGVLGAALGLSSPRSLSAHGSRECSDASLRGDFLASGVKALGPGTTERFTASGIWTFDGNGHDVLSAAHPGAAPALDVRHRWHRAGDQGGQHHGAVDGGADPPVGRARLAGRIPLEGARETLEAGLGTGREPAGGRR